MKRFIAVLAIAAVAGAAYAAAAAGGQRATGPTPRQFTLLKKQVASLKQRMRTQGGKIKTLNAQLTTLQGQVGTQGTTITTVQTDLTALQTDESSVKTTATNNAAFISNCLVAGGTVGISEYGNPTDPTNPEGYVYVQNSTNYLTTALDVDTSATPAGFFQLVAAGCVSSGTALHQAGVPLESRRSSFKAKNHH